MRARSCARGVCACARCQRTRRAHLQHAHRARAPERWHVVRGPREVAHDRREGLLQKERRGRVGCEAQRARREGRVEGACTSRRVR
eukprot:4940181-Prymnesium_polylepis.2